MLIFCLGCCIGSFVNVLIYRLPKKENFVMGRSYCPHCKHILGIFELIPLLSWLILKGRCAHCSNKISLRYPLIELCCGLYAVFCVYKTGMTWSTLLLFICGVVLLVISMIDIQTMLIPDSLNVFLMILAVLHFVWHPELNFLHRAIGFFIISFPLYILSVLYRNCFGGGDIKLMAIMGFMLGYIQIVVAFLCGLLLASIYSLVLVFMKKKDMKCYIPFAPFLSAGLFLSMYYGNEIIFLYLKFLHIV